MQCLDKRLTRKLVVKVDQLAIVDLLQKVLELLGFRATLHLVDSSQVIVDVFGVLSDAQVR